MHYSCSALAVFVCFAWFSLNKERDQSNLLTNCLHQIHRSWQTDRQTSLSSLESPCSKNKH